MSDNGFPANLWPDLEQRMIAGGAAMVVNWIAMIDGDDDRRKAFGFAVSMFGGRDWPGKSLDAVIAVADAAIAEALRQARAATDPAAVAVRTDAANVASYNLAAALADCWPDDPLPRERRHFERGLLAAERCLAWREELGKGPLPFSLAHWAEGMHALSLGDGERAIAGFRLSTEFAGQAAILSGKPSELSADAPFSVILGHGYLGLARWRSGDASGRRSFDAAIAAFTTQLDRFASDAGAKRDEAAREVAEDARFGLEQLQCVEAKYAPSGR